MAPSSVNVKASTGEGMGFVGRGEGVAALAVATVRGPGLAALPLAQAHLDLVLLAVLAAVALLLLVAYRSHVPYPILLVLGGAALGFVPGMPDLRLEPDVVLVVFLPPLLYAAAFFSSLHDLRDNLRPISLLAIGLVMRRCSSSRSSPTRSSTACRGRRPSCSGAVVSPTDPWPRPRSPRASGAPRRYVTIVEGEALINDSTALIAYKFAVAAVVTGSFSLADAVGRFVLHAAAGIAIGLAVGYVVARCARPSTTRRPRSRSR